MTNAETASGKATSKGENWFPNSGADGHEHLADRLMKEASHMTKEWRSDQEIEGNPRFGLHARVNSINIKAMLELQVL